MRGSALLILTTTGALLVWAHDIITTKLTFTRDVAPILEERCVSCHGAHDSIPLTTYEEVRPWAVGIKEQVLQRKMPPWGAVKGFGNFKNDQSLSQEEILILAAWVVGGAPEGNPLYLKHPVLVAQPRNENQPLGSVAVDVTRPLESPLVVLGVRPISSQRVESAKIVAHEPDGETIPVVWLYQHEPTCNVDYQFSQPLRLPAGTKLESPVPLRFDVAAKAPTPGV